MSRVMRSNFICNPLFYTFPVPHFIPCAAHFSVRQWPIKEIIVSCITWWRSHQSPEFKCSLGLHKVVKSPYLLETQPPFSITHILPKCFPLFVGSIRSISLKHLLQSFCFETCVCVHHIPPLHPLMLSKMQNVLIRFGRAYTCSTARHPTIAGAEISKINHCHYSLLGFTYFHETVVHNETAREFVGTPFGIRQFVFLANCQTIGQSAQFVGL